MSTVYRWISLVVCLFIVVPRLVVGQCGQFPMVNPETYDTTYVALGDATSSDRPLGFLATSWVYQSNDVTCFSVSGVTGQQVEIKFETASGMNLCYHRDDSPAGTPAECGSGRLTQCSTLVSDKVTFTFDCRTSDGCSEGDVNFWVRFNLGPKPEDDTENYWCSNRDSQYPNSLRSLAPNFTPPTEEASDISNSATIGYIVNYTFIITILVTLL